ncbi:response regulator [Phormidium sp. FACHB-1136]|uniref:response regulator n=1 Tax=Phormidium sp. FACHB-1136 TaxID=2692848 RepID=UPI0016852544|nr:response regulator [Phormidium sp. FACHB-1136]
MRVLIIEDDPVVAETLHHLLDQYRYSVDIASSAEAGLEMICAYAYDLLVLDRGLPGMDGVSLCQRLRTERQYMPILLLTGQGREGYYQAEALNAGADDYVLKPFDAEVLIARLQALLRRSNGVAQPILAWGNLSLNPSSRQVSYGSKHLSLTPKEFSILELLLRNSHRIFSAQAILDHAWDAMEAPGEEVVRYHIKELRHKLTLATAPKTLIETVHRVGYRLNPMYASPQAHPSEPILSASPLPLPSQIAELTDQNQQLCTALAALQKSQDDLRQQNTVLRATQAALTTERDYYQDLFQWAPEGYLVSDPQGIIKDVNQAISALLEIAPQDLIHQSLANFMLAADRQDFQAHLNHLSWPRPWKVRLQTRQANVVIVLLSTTPIVDAQQRITGLRWLIQDEHLDPE